MRVSTPETTVIDLVRFRKAAGQLDNVGVVVAELASSLVYQTRKRDKVDLCMS